VTLCTALYCLQATAKLDELVPGAGGALGGLLGGVLGGAGGGGAATGSRGIGVSLFSLALEMLGSAEVAQQVRLYKLCFMLFADSSYILCCAVCVGDTVCA
jgi:hypothetical protein